MKKAWIWITIITVLLVAGTAIAQSMSAQGSSANPAKSIKDPISSALRGVFPNRQKNTIAAVEAMPADKFSYKPTPEQITFGHLVAHMVVANYQLCSKTADVAAPKVDEVKDTDTKDKLVAALKASFDFCGDALAKMDDSKLGEIAASMGGQDYSRGRFALGLAGDWADHYAAAAMYLRLNGILPPTAKK
jgi:DinB superfamily